MLFSSTKFKPVAYLVVTGSLLVSLAGCSSKTLQGSYSVETETYNFPKTLTFESDGDCDYNGLGITYKIEDNTLRFYLGAISESYGFSKNGNKIILTKDGKSVTYIKN